MSKQTWMRMPGAVTAIALFLAAGCGDSADQPGNSGGSSGHVISAGAGGTSGKPSTGGSSGTPAAGGSPGVGGTSAQGGSGGIGEAGASGSGGSTTGQCGWSAENQWYECGSLGSDPGGTEPSQCPEGLSPSTDCGALTGVGCCDQDGNNWYCNDSGIVVREECPDGGSGGSSAEGGSSAGGAAGTGGGDSSNVAQLCVDIINQHRASIGRPALTRWGSAESCSDGEASSDSKTHIPHGAFGKCDEWAQNECPGWDGPVETMIA